MKKNILVTVLLFVVTAVGFAQCSVNSYIQDNYERDAQIFVLRDILNNPSDPDYDNPFIPAARLTPYLEKLSAIYENSINEPIIDSIFNEFQIHANPEYNLTITPYNEMIIAIDNDAPWIEDFKNTGVSGNAQLDNLMSTYQFSIYYYFVITSAGYTAFSIESSLDFLNVTALLNDFSAIPEVVNAETITSIDDRFNYTGIPYQISNEPVTTCDINIDNDIYTFVLYSGDCPAGCLFSRSFDIQVSESCDIALSVNDVSTFSEIVLYPNPASETLFIKASNDTVNSMKIYSAMGQTMFSKSSFSEAINISSFNSGIYFIEIISSEGAKHIQKFIKN